MMVTLCRRCKGKYIARRAGSSICPDCLVPERQQPLAVEPACRIAVAPVGGGLIALRWISGDCFVEKAITLTALQYAQLAIRCAAVTP